LHIEDAGAEMTKRSKQAATVYYMSFRAEEELSIWDLANEALSEPCHDSAAGHQQAEAMQCCL
jgi:hypothetical protein